MPEATSLTEAPTTAGTYAQYAVVSESVLGIKPKSLSISVPETKPGSLVAGLEQHSVAKACWKQVPCQWLPSLGSNH